MDDLDRLLEPIDFIEVVRESLDKGMFQRTVQSIKDDFGDLPLVQASLFSSTGRTMRQLGLHVSAIEPTRLSYERYRDTLGPDHPQTLDKLRELVSACVYGADLDLAERYIPIMVPSHRHVLGDDHDLTIGAIHLEGMFWVEAGESAKGVSCFREARDRYRMLYGEDHARTIRMAGELAIAPRPGRPAG